MAINEEIYNDMLTGPGTLQENYTTMKTANPDLDFGTYEDYEAALNNDLIDAESQSSLTTKQIEDRRVQYGIQPIVTGKSKDPKQPDTIAPAVIVPRDPTDAELIDGSYENMPEVEVYVVPEDVAVTLPKAEMEATDREREEYADSYINDYKRRYKVEFQQGKQVNPESLINIQAMKDAGYDDKTISMIIDKLRGDNFLPDSEGLQSDIISPFTAEFTLANKLMQPVMTVLGELGRYVYRSWKTRGIPRSMVRAVEQGDDEALAVYLKTVEDMKALKFGDEILTAKGKVSSNIFEQQKYAETVLQDSLNNLRSLMEGVTKGSTGLADGFKQVVDGWSRVMKINTQAAYESMRKAASGNKYPIKQLKEDINKYLTSSEVGIPESAMKKIEQIIYYQERTLSPAAKEASKKLKAIDNQISKVEGKLAGATGKEKGLLQAQLNRLKKSATTQKDLIPEVDYISELDFINMIQRINAQTSGSHMGISTSDKDIVRGLKLARKYVDDYFAAQTKAHNPAMYSRFKEAQLKAADEFRVFGKEGKRTEIGKILDSDDNVKALNHVLNNPHLVKQVGKALDSQKPGMGQEFARAWLNKKLGSVEEGAMGLISPKGLRTDILRSRIDTFMSNPENTEAVELLLGKDKLIQLKSLQIITGNVDDIVKNIGIKGPLDDGIRAYINSADGGMRTVGRAIEVVFDKFRQQTARLYDALPLKALTQAPGFSKFISSRYEKETLALDRLTKYINQHATTKDPTLKKVFEKRLGAWTAEVLHQQGVLDEEAIPVAEGLLAIGLAPAMIYKALGIAVGSATYVYIQEQHRKKKMREAEDIRKAKELKDAKLEDENKDKTGLWNKIFN